MEHITKYRNWNISDGQVSHWGRGGDVRSDGPGICPREHRLVAGPLGKMTAAGGRPDSRIPDYMRNANANNASWSSAKMYLDEV